MSRTKIDPDLKVALFSIYEEVMWLAVRPNVTASCARAWYTHIMAETVKRRIRNFSGHVSRAAIASRTAELRLEHYKRIQTKLTALVERHRSSGHGNPEEFVRTLLAYEQVHISLPARKTMPPCGPKGTTSWRTSSWSLGEEFRGSAGKNFGRRCCVAGSRMLPNSGPKTRKSSPIQGSGLN
jgi:hypothetical protein